MRRWRRLRRVRSRLRLKQRTPPPRTAAGRCGVTRREQGAGAGASDGCAMTPRRRSASSRRHSQQRRERNASGRRPRRGQGFHRGNAGADVAAASAAAREFVCVERGRVDAPTRSGGRSSTCGCRAPPRRRELEMRECARVLPTPSERERADPPRNRPLFFEPEQRHIDQQPDVCRHVTQLPVSTTRTDMRRTRAGARDSECERPAQARRCPSRRMWRTRVSFSTRPRHMCQAQHAACRASLVITAGMISLNVKVTATVQTMSS